MWEVPFLVVFFDCLPKIYFLLFPCLVGEARKGGGVLGMDGRFGAGVWRVGVGRLPCNVVQRHAIQCVGLEWPEHHYNKNCAVIGRSFATSSTRNIYVGCSRPLTKPGKHDWDFFVRSAAGRWWRVGGEELFCLADEEEMRLLVSVGVTKGGGWVAAAATELLQ